MKEISYDGPIVDEGAERRKLARSRGSEKVPPLRTFRGDVEEMVQEQNVTKAQIVMAEAARREERGESRVLHGEESHLGRIIFILLLVLAFGVGVGIYALIGTNATKQNITATAKPDRQEGEEISIDGAPREQIMADISLAFSRTNLATGKMRDITFTTKDKQGTRDATTAEVLTAISLTTPTGSLIYSLNSAPHYGIAVATSSLAGYFLIQTRSYPDSFAAMLEWEKDVAQDLLPSLNPAYKRTDILRLQSRTFIDERISGTDARVLRDIDGTLVIAYTFVKKTTLVIAGGEGAFTNLLLVASSTAQ